LTFIDSTLPMYLIGGPHRHKTDAQLILESLVAPKEPARKNGIVCEMRSTLR